MFTGRIKINPPVVMKRYRHYISVALILLLFCSLFLFRGNLIRYASRTMTDGMETTTKNTIENTLTAQYDYTKNKQEFQYTFLEFGADGCHSCQQMESVMKEIKEEYGSRVNVVFVNIRNKENEALVNYFGIVSIPTQVLLDKKGKEFFRHNGYWPADEMAKHFK